MINPIKALKALFAVNGAIKQIKESNMKNGFLTSEFWLSVIPIVASLWFTYSGLIPPALALKITLIAVAVYGVLRSALKIAEIVVKLTKSTKDDEIVNKINSVLDAVEANFKPKA